MAFRRSRGHHEQSDSGDEQPEKVGERTSHGGSRIEQPHAQG